MNESGSGAASTMQGVGFATTHWSVVLAAGRDDSRDSECALESLCRAYWFPLYAYARRRGHNPAEAQDLTQQFFLQMLRGNKLRVADPERGRFRSFLVRCFQNFMATAWKREHRGPGAIPGGFVWLDIAEGESRFAADPAEGVSPELAYDQRWGATLLARVLDGLREEYARIDEVQVFDSLSLLLWGNDETEPSYRRIAETLGMTEGAVRTAMHRLRSRFRERLRHEVAQTVSSPAEVEEELRYLVQVFVQSGQ